MEKFFTVCLALVLSFGLAQAQETPIMGSEASPPQVGSIALATPAEEDAETSAPGRAEHGLRRRRPRAAARDAPDRPDGEQDGGQSSA